MMLGGRIAKLLLGIGLLTLAGCGGGGGGGGSSRPPDTPWTLNIYQAPNGEKVAQGALTNQAGQYLIELEGKAYALSSKDVTLSADKVALTLTDQEESFAPAEFSREMAHLAQGRSATLHSLASGRVYEFKAGAVADK